MQIKLTIVFVAAALALASLPAFAVDMPADGTKNFSAPSDAPSYFTDEAVPESARIDHPVPFTSEDLAAAPEVEPAYPSRSETGWHGKHAFAHKSTRHASGRGHGGSTHYARATSSRSTRPAGFHKPTTGAGKSGTQAGASKMNTTRHARTGWRQHAAAAPQPGSTPTPAG